MIPFLQCGEMVVAWLAKVSFGKVVGDAFCRKRRSIHLMC